MGAGPETGLVAVAIGAMGRAYAAYWRLPVGAAIRDETDAVHLGANVENATYPGGNCAEASAIAAMMMAGGTRIAEIAVAGGDGGMLCTPCGACRQRIREPGKADTPVLVCGPEGLMRRFTLDELLPENFGLESLG